MLLDPDSDKSIINLRRLVHVVNLAHYPEYDECFINHLRLKPFKELQ